MSDWWSMDRVVTVDTMFSNLWWFYPIQNSGLHHAGSRLSRINTRESSLVPVQMHRHSVDKEDKVEASVEEDKGKAKVDKGQDKEDKGKDKEDKDKAKEDRGKVKVEKGKAKEDKLEIKDDREDRIGER
ncbi:uncharacterized protein [Watersipora subatra]|uniref:uncharacterized protein n=1 Tax=Watersipora subatra TaxID=2589382 RepID=UPI00355BAA60